MNSNIVNMCQGNSNAMIFHFFYHLYHCTEITLSYESSRYINILFKVSVDKRSGFRGKHSSWPHEGSDRLTCTHLQEASESGETDV